MIIVNDLHKKFVRHDKPGMKNLGDLRRLLGLQKTAEQVVQAVNGVSFTANDGQISGSLGANRAGTTTTLRMFATRLQPDTANVFVGGVGVSPGLSSAHSYMG